MLINGFSIIAQGKELNFNTRENDMNNYNNTDSTNVVFSSIDFSKNCFFGYRPVVIPFKTSLHIGAIRE